MSDNWVVQNLENALATWNEKLAEIWQLITQSPEQFKGGTIWNVVLLIHDTMQAIGLALLVLFFVVGVVKTCGSFAEIKRPEAAGKIFFPFFRTSKNRIPSRNRILMPHHLHDLCTERGIEEVAESVGGRRDERPDTLP